MFRRDSSESPRYAVISLRTDFHTRTMRGDRAAPKRSGDQSIQELKGKNLIGWEEIRSALQLVERYRESEQHTDVRVEVYDHSGESSPKVSFRSLQELDDYLRSSFRMMLIKDGPESELDVMAEVHG